MATIESVFNKNLYTTSYAYDKVQGADGAKPRSYDGTVILAAGITQKNGNTFPLVHAKDIQLGKVASERLTEKLAAYDAILRDIYGRKPSELEALTDGRDATTLTALSQDNGVIGATGSSGIHSFNRIAQILNNRTETIDDRIKDLRGFVTFTFTGSSTTTTDQGSTVANIVADNNADVVTVKVSNKWLKIQSSAEDDSFSISHLVQSISNDTGIYDFNSTAQNASETFDVDRISYDEAGHIRTYHKHTYTLPKSWKTIAVGAASAATDNQAGNNADKCVADTLIDTLTLYSGNKWINIAAKRAQASTATDDAITFSHALSSFTATTGMTDFNDTEVGKTFAVDTLSYDKAGHVISYNKQTYTLPDNFKFVKVNANSNAVTEKTTGASTAGTCTAGSLVDTLTLNTSNKWIHITPNKNATNGNATNNITFSHVLSSFTKTTGSTDFNNNGTDETFTVDTFSYDEAGHITGYNKQTYTLQKSWKTVSVGAASTSVENNVGSVQGSCIADTIVSTLSLYSGNKWINIAANRAGSSSEVNDSITFSHVLSELSSGAHELKYNTSAQAPNFGGTFNIPKMSLSLTTDAAGHVTAYSSSNGTTTVTIPSISLSNSGSGNIVTKMSLSTESGAAFTVSKAYIGALALTGYSEKDNITDNDVKATDTLNSAVKKLETKADSILSDVKTLLQDFDISLKIKLEGGKKVTGNTAIDFYYYGNSSDIAQYTLTSGTYTKSWTGDALVTQVTSPQGRTAYQLSWDPGVSITSYTIKRNKEDLFETILQVNTYSGIPEN